MRLDRYIARIGLSDVPPASTEGLALLQDAHRRAIAFENLDIMLGRGIAIDSESVFDKLVTRGRGGYCFEQNRLFADMLAEMGIASRPLLARVRLFLPEGYVPPRTHTLVLAEFDGRRVIGDAGFGGSPIPSLPLADRASAVTPDGGAHRLVRTGESSGSLDGEWRLERAGPVGATDGRAAPHEDWQPQYSFDLAHVAPEDLEMGNHWTSTRPGTRFTSLHVVSIPLAEGFASLTDRKLTIFDRGETASREITGPDDYGDVLEKVFGLSITLEEVKALPIFSR